MSVHEARRLGDLRDAVHAAIISSRILQSMQGNKGASIRSPIKAAEQRPLTSSEETAQFLAEMANK